MVWNSIIRREFIRFVLFEGIAAGALIVSELTLDSAARGSGEMDEPWRNAAAASSSVDRAVAALATVEIRAAVSREAEVDAATAVATDPASIEISEAQVLPG